MAKKKAKEKRPLAGRYRTRRILGRGAGGTVYSVVDLQEGDRTLALKLVKIPKGGDTPLLEDLKNEFATLSLLNHPNLARVHDFGNTEKEVYFSSEYIDGRDILEATRGVDLNTVFHLIVQILRALDYLHQRGVLHLDLKPANILVTDPDRTGELSVKLIDFGIAQWKRHGRIQSGVFSGTPPYAAPEVAQEREPSPASDIYSLGMILHQIFTGAFPFPSQEPMQILMRQTTEDPLRVASLDPALPAQFADLLHRMVARDPSQRFRNAREVLDEINRCLGENFSLRSPRAPAKILQESDHFLHPELLEELTSLLLGAERVQIELSGAHGSGRSRLTERVKELLQLRGLRPLYFRNVKAAREFLKKSTNENERPLLLDLSETPSENLKEDLQGYAGSILWTVQSRGDGLGAGEPRRVSIPNLDTPKLARFFREEIRNTPEGIPAKILASDPALSPSGLEDLLQALREEGRLVWGPAGWSWQGEEPVDYAGLWARYEARKEERKKTIREFLETSGLAFPAGVLEGMVGLEPGGLGRSLIFWLDEGWMRCEVRKGVPFFQGIQSNKGKVNSRDSFGGPEGLAKQLQNLYDQGRFAAGLSLVDILEREKSGAVFPAGLALSAARLSLASGKYQRALDLLPKKIPLDPTERGLFYEIQGRAYHRLGKFSDGEEAAKLSEEAYREGGDNSGLSRAINLFGSIAKDQNRFDQAEAYFQKAVETALTVEDYYSAGILQSNLALAYQHQGKIDAALQAYQRAWEFARKNQNPFFLQVLYHNWVILLYYMGKAKDAEQACYEWLKLALTYGAKDQQAFAFNYLAQLAGQRRHLEMQRSYLDQAIALLEPARSPRLAAQMRVHRAYLNWEEGKFLPAQLDAEAALELGKALPDDTIMSWIFLILGIVYRDRPRPDYAQSETFLQEALDRVERQQNRPLLWEVQFHRGLLEKALGRWDRAKDYLTRAMQALEDMLAGMPDLMKQSYLRDRKAERIQAELKALEPGD